MEARAHSPIRLAITYGVITGILCVALTLIFYMTPWFSDLWTGYLSSGILFLGVLFSVIHANKVMGGNASLSNLFIAGIVATVIAVGIQTGASLIIHLVTEPAAGTVDIPSQDGRHLSEYSENKREGFWIFLLGNVFFTNGVMGLLASVIGAVTAKRNQKTSAARRV